MVYGAEVVLPSDIRHDSPQVAAYVEADNEEARQDALDLLDEKWDIAADVSVLGTGVPRLACLRPAAWLGQWPSAAHLHRLKLKTLARGQASWGGRCKASSGTASPGRLAGRRRDQGRGTSRGAHDATHDDRD